MVEFDLGVCVYDVEFQHLPKGVNSCYCTLLWGVYISDPKLLSRKKVTSGAMRLGHGRLLN